MSELRTADDGLSISRDGTIGILSLSRPQVLNAIHAPLRAAIRRALASAADNAAVAGIVVTGAGRAFTAGQDVGELAELDADGARAWITDLGRLYTAVRDFPKPIVVAINGVAAGAGLQISLHADLRIGCPDTRMAQTEIDIGLPSVLGPWVMNRIMGIGPTLEMSLTGRLVGSDEALRLGMLNRVVPADELLSAAVETARALAAKPPRAVEATKRWIGALEGKSWEETIAAAGDVMAAAFASGEPQRMIGAFRETRARRRRG